MFDQEWNTTKEEFMARWSLWHNLPNSTRKELHLHAPSQGPNWFLLLLPISCNAQSCRWIWWLQDSQPSNDSRPFSSSCRRLHHPRRRLVQGQSHCKISNIVLPIKLLFYVCLICKNLKYNTTQFFFSNARFVNKVGSK